MRCFRLTSRTPVLAHLFFGSLLLLGSPPILAASTSEETRITETTQKDREEDREEDTEVVSQTEVERVRIEEGTDQEPAPRQQAGRAAGEDGIVQERTVVTRKEVEEGGLDDEMVGIIPQFGFVTLGDLSDDDHTRAVAGFTVDGNLLADVPTRPGKPFLGPSIGVFYSHLGQPGGNFFGVDSPEGDEGADLVLIPLNAKAGYTFNEKIRLSVHGGLNLAFQSEEAAFENEDWDTAGNFGADLEFGLGQDVLLLVRPDWTFRSGADVFSGTLGLGFPIS